MATTWNLIDALRQDSDRAFQNAGVSNDAASRAAFLPGRAARRYPLVHLAEDRNYLYVGAFAPSVAPESISISVLRHAEDDTYCTNLLAHPIAASSKSVARHVQSTITLNMRERTHVPFSQRRNGNVYDSSTTSRNLSSFRYLAAVTTWDNIELVLEYIFWIDDRIDLDKKFHIE